VSSGTHVSAPATAVTVRVVEVLPLRLPLGFRRTLSKGEVTGQGRPDWVADPVLVRIESTDGVAGYAQVRPPIPWLGETTASIVTALRQCYAPLLLGADALQREALAARMESALPGNPVARAALDIALHDLVARTQGIPVHALLGGGAREISLDWSISLNPADAMVAEAERAVGYGIRLLCVKMGPASRWREDVETFRAIRAAVGPDVEIGVDPNEGYDLATCLRVLRLLAAEGVAYAEQPLPRDDHEALRALRFHALAPVYLDESATHLAEVQRLIVRGACDGLVLKLWKSGGFGGAQRMAALAEAAGLGTTVGGVAQGSVIEAAACAHLASSLVRPPLGAEFVLGLNVVDRDPIAALPAEMAPAGGRVVPPHGPGLGVEVDMEAARALALADLVLEEP
jgi:L-alanine-DL-glutamate epimerase-like enolase superfamily enzyme